MIDAPLLLFILSISALALFGFSLASSLLPARLYWLGLALTPGIGAGVCAFVFFVFRRPMFTVEFVLFIAGIFLLWRKRSGFTEMRVSDLRALAFLLPAVTIVIISLSLRADRLPHGSWDGWAIWNWEARLLYRAGENWRQYLPLAFHGDYPLLVPSMTARFWRYMGGEIPDVGAFLGILLALCSIAVLALTLTELRSRMVGVVMCLTLLGTPSYLYWAAAHYADIPLSFFFLGTLALIAIHFESEPERRDFRLLVLAGFLAGCAGWTKNEGILFIVAVTAALLVPVFRYRSEALNRFKAFSAGAALPVLIITFFKLTNNVSNYVVAFKEGKLQRMFDLGRHFMIWDYVVRYLFSFGAWSISPFIPLIAFILLTGVHRSIFANYGWRTIVTILVIVCAGYYLVYLMTPVDLKWHLEASLDRLFLQLWPSVLLLAGLGCQPGWGKPRPELAVVARGYGKH
jgi:hypothetical protein